MSTVAFAVSRRGNAAIRSTLLSSCNATQVFAGSFSTSTPRQDTKHYELLVVGGGTGGTAAAHMFRRKLGKGKIAVIEPKEVHYYQPLWTLVGGGLRKFDESVRTLPSVLPNGVDWIKDEAVEFQPQSNTVVVGNGEQIKYDYLVCSLGLQLNYNKIKNAVEALETDPMVCSNYSPNYVRKTFPAIEAFKEGNAIFTFPNSPIKCGGAPQKIMYLAEECFRMMGKRDKANITYYTSLGGIFAVKKYAESLMKIVQARDLNLVTRHHLVEVRPESREAVFENLDTQQTVTVPYHFLHITPPMSTPDCLARSPLVDASGYLTVDKETFQHTEFPNVFGIGDCMNSPNAKSAAAIASQCGVLKANLAAVMEGKPTGNKKYAGYTSCPLVTGKNKCIMAEFDWNGNPIETFPIDQGKERWSMFRFKNDIFPRMYWLMLVRGYWHGPTLLRKLLHLGRV